MLPVLWRKLIIYNHIICSSTITSVPGFEHGYNRLWYSCLMGFTSTDLASHTLLTVCLELTFVWYVCLQGQIIHNKIQNMRYLPGTLFRLNGVRGPNTIKVWHCALFICGVRNTHIYLWKTRCLIRAPRLQSNLHFCFQHSYSPVWDLLYGHIIYG